ncbi:MULTISPECIES: hypothetical protein [Aminobacter]|jgi:hypothetical protein|uniref:Phasin domain-containing protein n=2 Tax=Aminobacter TaxID=31988 RepID=A0AAC9FDM1_AMIAI|nr:MULTISPECIES: hypothetical protein [Aminobacter]AMS41970.1 hypothetical protein AA2016_3046 [Aminobacter aminovorans]MBA8904911.1 hypothetical protein [Aminobacter ciceronei]MBA9018535.1 hypothetical protein [Aminobacter ciceronei]MBB3706790.1 hypothetical protein [Aminobacter aminovorans]MRX31559.1 hypothetical protein [Aminobacter sp. MDW-2]
MKNRRLARASRHSGAIAGNLMLAPMVMAMRLPMMATEARKGGPLHGESLAAVTEKTTAMAEGMVAAQISYFQSALQFWPEVLSGRTPSVLNGVAAQKSVAAALKPASKRVRANFRRLATKSGT